MLGRISFGNFLNEDKCIHNENCECGNIYEAFGRLITEKLNLEIKDEEWY